MGDEEASTSGRTWPQHLANAQRVFWSSGTSCMALASLLQSVSSLCVKLMEDRVPVFQIVLVRSAICMAVTLGLLRLHAVSPMFGHAKSHFALLVRGGAGATSMSVYYFAIMALPLADVMTLFFAHPAMVVALAWVCRGETVRWTGLAGMLLSLVGVVAVAQPPFLTGSPDWTASQLIGVGNSLLAAVLAAMAFVAIRFIPKEESSLTIALSFHTMGVLTSAIPLTAGIPSRAVLASPKDWAYLLTIAFCSTTSHAFIARAFQVESAAKGAAIGYLQVVLGYSYGVVIFHDPMSLLSISGSAVICLGVVAVSWPHEDPENDSDNIQKVAYTEKAETESLILLELPPDYGKRFVSM